MGTAAAGSNAYAARTAWREDFRFRRAKDVPQGETLLVHAWAWAVTQYPPQGMTIWLHRTEPTAGSYEFFITGDAVLGDFPDRRLYEEVRKRRRQPTIAEHFSGRIRAVSHDGSVIEIAGGHIELPPEPTQQSTPWGQPPAPGQGAPYGPTGPMGSPPPGWGGGWGGPPSPWSGAPSWPASPWGAPMPPWMMPPPWWAQHAQPAPPQPPAAVQNNPDLLSMWNAMHAQMQPLQDAQAQLMKELMTRAFAATAPAATVAAQAGKPPELIDQVRTLGALADALDKIRGPAPAAAGAGERRGIHIHRVDDHTLVETKDGDLDPVATAIFEVKDAVKSVASRRLGGGLLGKSPSSQPTNGAPKTANGTKATS